MASEVLSTVEFTRDYQRYLGSWLDTGIPSDEYYLESVREGITFLFEQLNIQHFQFIICPGPLQLTVFPALVELMLQLGQEHASNFRFDHSIGEPPSVRKEWDGLWQDALKQIDWQAAQGAPAGLGSLIDTRVEHTIMDPLVLRLVAEIDVDLDTDDHLLLQKRFRNDLRMMTRRFRGAMMFHRLERENLWRSLLARIPSQQRPLLHEEPSESEKKKRRPRQPPLHPSKLQGHLIGSFDWTWLTSIDFARNHLDCKLPEAMIKQADMWLQLAFGATGYFLFENCCFVYLRPREAFFDEQGRLHHEKKAAAEFVDGSAFFFWHGVEVPEYVITNPEDIRLKLIEKERNIEVRRIMIERYGFENFVASMKKIQEDDFGTLYSRDLPGDEPIVIVRVVNSTPEPDGTFKNYFLRVPPGMETAKEAVAWTFAMTEREYLPDRET